MIIDGQEIGASDGKTFPSLDPATGQPWALIPEATHEDVERAVQAAHKAQKDWANLSATQRGKALMRLADVLADHSEAIGHVETRDTGKLLAETTWQAAYIAEYLRFFGGAADKIGGQTLPIDKPDMMVMTMREPLGVVAAIIPWNSQMFLSATKIGPALAMGNTLVLKASEHASAPLLEFGKLAKIAGLPDGVINVITGHGDICGRALTSHPLIQKIAFTGGPETARQIVRNSAQKTWPPPAWNWGGNPPLSCLTMPI